MARYCIVGGVAGGATTAARLRRLDENTEIIIFQNECFRIIDVCLDAKTDILTEDIILDHSGYIP